MKCTRVQIETKVAWRECLIGPTRHRMQTGIDNPILEFPQLSTLSNSFILSCVGYNNVAVFKRLTAQRTRCLVSSNMRNRGVANIKHFTVFDEHIAIMNIEA